MSRTRLPLLPLAAVLALACARGDEGVEVTHAGTDAAAFSVETAAADRAMSRTVMGSASVRGIAGAGAMASPAAPPPPPPPPMPGAAQPDAVTRADTYAIPDPGAMVIRTGTAAVEVADLDAALRDLAALAARVGGTVANTTVLSGREQIPTATVELRLPPARYDDALGGLTPLGTVRAVNVTADDVGEEYTDLAARAANARRLEERLLGLLAARTGKLEEVLAVERELARVREEIERIEGRLRWLRARTATSTLAVTLHEPAPLAGTAPGRSPIADAFREAWANVVAVVAFLIAASGIVLPLLVLGGVAWLVVRRWLPWTRPAGTAPSS